MTWHWAMLRGSAPRAESEPAVRTEHLRVGVCTSRSIHHSSSHVRENACSPPWRLATYIPLRLLISSPLDSGADELHIRPSIPFLLVLQTYMHQRAPLSWIVRPCFHTGTGMHQQLRWMASYLFIIQSPHPHCYNQSEFWCIITYDTLDTI